MNGTAIPDITTNPYSSYRRIRQLLIAGCCGFGLLLVVAGTWLLLSERSRLLREAEGDTRSLARALEEHVLRTLSSVDLGLRYAGDRVLQLGELESLNPAAVTPLLKTQADRLPFVRSIYVHDKNGKGHSTSSGIDNRHLNGFDYEHIRAPLMNENDTLHVGRVTKGALTQRLNIPFSRRLVDRQNRLAGVIAGAIEISYFEQFYDSLNVQDGAIFSIVRADGAVLIRYPRWDGMLTDISHRPFYKNNLLQRDIGTVFVDKSIDQRSRIMSYRRVNGSNIFVIFSLDQALVLAPWVRQAVISSILITVCLGALFGLLLVVLRQLHERMRAEEQVTSIVHTARDGIISINERQEITLLNPATERLFGYKASELLGKPLSFLLPERYRLSHVDRIATFSQTATVNLVMGAPGNVMGLRANGEEFLLDATVAQINGEAGWMATVILRDITERANAESELRESRQRLIYALDATAEGLWDWNLSTGETLFSVKWIASLGYAPEDVPSTIEFRRSIVHPDDLPGETKALQAHLAKYAKIFEVESRLRMKSGEYRHNLARGKVVEWNKDGTPLRVVGTDTDITERKHEEKSLQDNYELLDRLFSTTHFSVVYLDRDFNYLRVNRAYADACGHSQGFFVGKNHFALFPGKEVETIFQRVVNTGKPYTVDARPFEYPDLPTRGVTYWDWTLQPMFNARGTVEGLLFASVDVTKREHSAQQVRESEIRLRLAAQAGNICFWDCVTGAEHGYFTAEMNRELGYRDKEMPVHFDDWAARMHPDDKAQVWPQIGKYLEGQTADHRIEYRLRSKDGNWQWIYDRGERFRDPIRASQRLAGCHVDVTELKQTQFALQSRMALTELVGLLARFGNETAVPEEAMQACLERLCHFGQWTLGRIGFYQQDVDLGPPHHSVWHGASLDQAQEFIHHSEGTKTYVDSGGMLTTVLREKKAVWISDIQKEHGFVRKTIALAHGFRTAFAFPLVVDRKVSAFLEFFGKTPRPVDPNLIAPSEAIGAQLARLIERYRADEINARLAAIVESSNDAIFSRAIDGTILMWNGAAERLYGWSAQEAIGQTIALIVPPKELDALRPMIARVIGGEFIGPVESTHVCKDGSHVDIQVTLSPVRNTQGHIFAISNTVRDITESKRNEIVLRQLHRKLRLLSRRLREVEEEDREALSRELHDRIGQDLSTLGLMLEMLRTQISTEGRTDLNGALDDMQKLLMSVIGHVRNVMAELRPPALEQFGIVAALKDLAADYTRKTRIPVRLNGAKSLWRPPLTVETAIYRIVQEALNNTAKHAQATQVKITQRATAGNFELRIADDGIGFDVANLSSDKPRWGLSIMRERAEVVDIDFQVDSTPGRGTQIILRLKAGAPG